MSDSATPDSSDLAELNARREQIEAALDGVLVDGERWLVQRDRDHVHVSAAEHENSGRSLLRFTHPELYGRLVALDERLRTAGGLIGFEFALLVSLAGIAAVEAGWLAGVLPPATLASLASGWVYALFVAAVFVLVFGWRNRAARRVWREEADSVRRWADQAQLSTTELLAVLDGDSALNDLLPHLKRDEREGRWHAP